jgi:hypothetical protein
MYRKTLNILSAIGLALFAAAAVPQPARGALCDFENFSEGNLGGGPFTDPISGITFSNPISANNNFIIEFGSAAGARPLTSPGNVLTTNGFAPGNGFALGHQFNFTATLPAPTGQVDMEMVYTVGSGGNAQVTVIGYNSANVQVASTVFNASSGNFLETTLSLVSGGTDISSFKVTAVDVFNGHDNIRFTPVPEPGGLAAAFVGVTALAARNRRRVR